MDYIADDLELDAWVKAGLASLERYLVCWRLFAEPAPADAPRHIGNELSCLDILELATDCIENALRAGDRRRFDHHLTDCPGCATYVDRMRETIRVDSRVPREEPRAPTLRERLMSQFRSWKRAG